MIGQLSEDQSLTLHAKRAAGAAGSVNVQDVLRGDGDEGAVLALEDDGAGLEGLQAVPAAGLDGHSDGVGPGRDGHLLREGTSVVIEVLRGPAPQYHHRLRRAPMPMDRQHRPRLQRIQHPLRAVRG